MVTRTLNIILFFFIITHLFSCSISNEKVNISSVNIVNGDSILTDSNLVVYGMGLNCKIKFTDSMKNSTSKIKWSVFKNNGTLIGESETSLKCSKEIQDIHLLIPSFLFKDYKKGIHSFKYMIQIDNNGNSILESDIINDFFVMQPVEVVLKNIAVDINEKDLTIHLDLGTENFQQCPLKLKCYFFDKNGNTLKDTNYKVCDESGNVLVEKDIIPRYRSYCYRDLKFSISYDELHLDYNKKPIYFVIFVQSHVFPDVVTQSANVRFVLPQMSS